MEKCWITDSPSLVQIANGRSVNPRARSPVRQRYYPESAWPVAALNHRPSKVRPAGFIRRDHHQWKRPWPSEHHRT